jgi:ribonuclease HI
MSMLTLGMAPSNGQKLHTVLDAKAHHLMSFRLQWIPSHRGVDGNEIADHLAKASSQTAGSTRLPQTSISPKSA